MHRLERFLNTLGTIASAAPLLGLMGTVIGMIEIFGSQAPTGGNNPALLAHGISVALYNTAVTSPGHALVVADIACRAALGGRGVAHITVPKDVQAMKLSADTPSMRPSPRSTQRRA